MTLIDDRRRGEELPASSSVIVGRSAMSRRRWRASAILVTVWALAVAVAARVSTPWYVHRAALFVHLVSLVAGFGAVLVADVHGVLWLLGRRRLDQLLLVTHVLHSMIWSGLLGLTLSGVLLHPNLSLPRTQIKLVLVLVAGLNGLWVGSLSKRLARLRATSHPGAINARLVLSVMASGAISQAAWWGAGSGAGLCDRLLDRGAGVLAVHQAAGHQLAGLDRQRLDLRALPWISGIS